MGGISGAHAHGRLREPLHWQEHHHPDEGILRWLTSPSEMGVLALLSLMTLVALLVLLAVGPVSAQGLPADESQAASGAFTEAPAVQSTAVAVERYILAFLGKMRDIRWKRTPALAALIVEAADRHGLDPLLLAIVAKAESSFWEVRKGARLRDAATAPLVGARGERGLLQVWGMAAVGCDLTSSAGQLDCGAAWLRSRIDSCGGDVLCGLERYQGKKCPVEVSRRGRRSAAPYCGPLARFREWESVRASVSK